MDARLNSLLKWGIENSVPNNDNDNNNNNNNNNNNPSDTTSSATPSNGVRALPPADVTTTTTTSSDAPAPAAAARGIDPALMAALFGGPSDAELMKAAMAVITDPSPSVARSDRLVAFDNLEQLIESLDNANNLSALSLWTPLLDLLRHRDRALRRMAAWCVGTAVQNNAPSQERLLAMGGIPTLVDMATTTTTTTEEEGRKEDDEDEDDEAVRRKAIYALSSAVRNYQPAMDVAAEALAKKKGGGVKEGETIDANDMDAVDRIMTGLKNLVPPARASGST